MLNFFPRRCLLLCLLTISFISVNARWIQTNGPCGAEVNCFLVNGNYVFAGTTGGIFRSADNGVSWAAVNSGLTNTTILALASTSTGIFAGTNGDGVFRSTDNGASWVSVNQGLTDTTVNTFAIKDSTIFAGTTNNIFVSTNNGATWNILLNLQSDNVTSLDVSGPNLLIVTYVYNYIYNLDSSIAAPLNPTVADNYIQSFVNIDSTVFAGTASGIFVSTDQGINWTAKDSGLTNGDVHAMATDGVKLFAGTDQGVFTSLNGGNAWKSSFSGLRVFPISAMAVRDSVVFAGSNESGLFYSNDYGLNWVENDSGLTNLYVSALAIKDSNIFSGTDGGRVFTSSDNGSYWLSADSGLPANSLVETIALNGNDIFIGLLSLVNNTSGGVYVSHNNGISWANAGLTNLIVYSLAAHNDSIFAATGGSGILRSIDDGVSWVSVNTGLTTNAFYALAFSGYNLFAGSISDGMFLSTNNGASWTAIDNGLPNSFYINCLGISDANIYLGTDHGVFLSTNNGTSWASVNSGLPTTNIYSFTFRQLSVYVGTDDGVFVSTNNGSSWQSFNTGLTSLSINALGSDSNNIYAGTNTGVWRYQYPEIINTGITDETEGSTNFLLGQNYPNPFSDLTNIPFTLPYNTHVRINIYNVLGNEVATVVDENLPPGDHAVSWSTTELSQGIYYYRIEAGPFVSTKELILMR